MQRYIKNPVQQLPWSFFYTQKKLTSFDRWKKPPEAFYKKSCSKNFSKSTGKTFNTFSFLIKLQAWGLELYSKRDSGLRKRLFPFIFFEILRTPSEAEQLRATAYQPSQLVSQKSSIVDFSLDSKYVFYMQY